jgi:hypothetical protein
MYHLTLLPEAGICPSHRKASTIRILHTKWEYVCSAYDSNPLRQHVCSLKSAHLSRSCSLKFSTRNCFYTDKPSVSAKETVKKQLKLFRFIQFLVLRHGNPHERNELFINLYRESIFVQDKAGE